MVVVTLNFLEMVYSLVDDKNLFKEDNWASTILTGDFFCCNWCKVTSFSGEKRTARTASFSEVCDFKSKYFVVVFDAVYIVLRRWT